MPFLLCAANQKGGVTKTTTTVHLGRAFAEAGYKTLIVDTDSQGSIARLFRVGQEEKNIFSFLVRGWAIQECVIPLSPNLELLPSDRETLQMEAILLSDPDAMTSYAMKFRNLERADYDVVLMDTAPTINLMQNCAALYCKQLILPVIMDIQAIQGAVMSITGFQKLSPTIKPVAVLPANVDRRLVITSQILESVESLSKEYGIPILPAIRTDSLVSRALKAKQMLPDYDPTSKAYADYKLACKRLVELFQGQLNVQQKLATTA
jgi:chromosome partitioning protein